MIEDLETQLVRVAKESADKHADMERHVFVRALQAKFSRRDLSQHVLVQLGIG
ncbi:MAG: hypothetical protein WKF60_01495 [Ilumatobacter sp.]